MVGVLFFAFVITAALVLLLARYGTNPAALHAGEAALGDSRPRMSGALLRAQVVDLLGALGLGVVEEELRGDARRLIAARLPETMPGSRYVVFVEPSPPADVVDQAKVVELAEYVKSERAAVGMLVTPYAIDAEGLAGIEVPLELIDGARLRQMVATQLPERLPELDRYRGFGISARRGGPAGSLESPEQHGYTG